MNIDLVEQIKDLEHNLNHDPAKALLVAYPQLPADMVMEVLDDGRTHAYFRKQPDGSWATHRVHSVGDTWYRLEDRRMANYNPWYDDWDAENTGYHIDIHTRTAKVEKVTPCGVQLLHIGFVNFLHHKERYSNTLDAAIASFKARKAKQLSIYENRIGDIKKAIKLAENMLGPKGSKDIF